jgi:predicted nucleic acid-binding protein
MQVAIDSSVLVGILAPKDLWHERAVALWKRLEDAGHTTVYFDCVAAETISVATRRLHEKGLQEEVELLLNRLKRHLPTSKITWIFPDVQFLYGNVLALMQRSGGALNFNDALIALACQERQIPAIATFDNDFDQIPWLQRFHQPENLD